MKYHDKHYIHIYIIIIIFIIIIIILLLLLRLYISTFLASHGTGFLLLDRQQSS